MCFRWRSEHSTAVGSQNENESKAQQEKKKKLNGYLTFLLHHITHVLIHSLDYILLTDCFVRLMLFYFFAFLSALVQSFRHLRLLGMFWRKWTDALHLRQWNENSSKCLTGQHRDTNDSQTRILIINRCFQPMAAHKACLREVFRIN